MGICKVELQEKIKELDEQINSNPNDAEALHDRAQAKLYLDHYYESIEDCNNAILINPDIASIYNIRGCCYFSLLAYDLASEDFEKAIDLDSSFYKAYFNLARIRNMYQDEKGAIAHLNRAVIENPKEPLCYYYRCKFNTYFNNFEDALLDLNQAIVLNPDFYEAYFERAFIYLRFNHNEKALSDLNKAAEINPDDPDIYILRSKVKSKLYDTEGAEEDYKIGEELANR